MKLLQPLFVAMAVTLSISACSTSDSSLVTEEGKLASLSLAQMTIESASMAINAMRDRDSLDNKQIACIDSINMDPATQQVGQLLQKEFSEAELIQLNKFYSSSAAKAYNTFGLEQLIISSGGHIASLSAKPSLEQVKQVKGFTQTALGQQYLKFNQSSDDDGLTAVVNDYIIDEVKKCGIQMP